jgi:hypothetical protein
MSVTLSVLLASAMSGQLKPDGLVKSTWVTVYETPQRAQVRAVVEIDGNNGKYFPQVNPRIVGALDRVRLVPKLNHPDGPATAAVVGRWTLGGQSGYFVFRVPDPDGIMDGYWGYMNHQGQFGPIVGSWDGRLVSFFNGQVNQDPRDPGPVAPD